MTNKEAQIALANLKRYMSGGGTVDRGTNRAIDMAIEVLGKPEPHWIPVSERLPEEKKDVLIAFKHNMAVGFWEDIWENGEPAWYAKSGDGWMTGTTAVDSDGIPIAWMPLPEPYREGEQG